MEGNVQQLLAAERKANEIIENAQQKKYYIHTIYLRRTTLMKEAKFHATQEIEKFKQSEEKRYNDELEKVLYFLNYIYIYIYNRDGVQGTI